MAVFKAQSGDDLFTSLSEVQTKKSQSIFDRLAFMRNGLNLVFYTFRNN